MENHGEAGEEPSQESIKSGNIVVIPKEPINPGNVLIDIAPGHEQQYTEAREDDVWQQQQAVVVIPKANLEPVNLNISADMLAQYKSAIENDVWNDSGPNVIVFRKAAEAEELAVQREQLRDYERAYEEDVWETQLLDPQSTRSGAQQGYTERRAAKPISPARQRYNEILNRTANRKRPQIAPVRPSQATKYFASPCLYMQQLPPISQPRKPEVVSTNGIDFVKRYNQALMKFEEFEITDDNKAASRAKNPAKLGASLQPRTISKSLPQARRAGSTTAGQCSGQYEYLSVGKLVKEIIATKAEPAGKVDEMVGDL